MSYLNSFSELKVVNTVDEFSTDGTLAGDSDTALPTEKAVKTYVDTALFNQYGASDGITADTAATYQQKLRITTPTLVAGNYTILWTCEISISDENSDINIRVQVDDATTINQTSGRVADRNLYYIRSGFVNLALTNATHTIDLDYFNSAAKTLSIRNARIEITRRI